MTRLESVPRRHLQRSTKRTTIYTSLAKFRITIPLPRRQSAIIRAPSNPPAPHPTVPLLSSCVGVRVKVASCPSEERDSSLSWLTL